VRIDLFLLLCGVSRGVTYAEFPCARSRFYYHTDQDSLTWARTQLNLPSLDPTIAPATAQQAAILYTLVRLAVCRSPPSSFG
jgi:hypothetical protein